ncbi:hypothetical protein MA16_Dca006688 [Dendrobium catenatum]|uniref:Reverse transcriptase zinc-binding domain-containing protein n=1 Tax=Dendrobium catenatum TaxID=906689 RepID=A0A2I0X5W1_9ASPA|nr:hypothetical protein MA16_Dca006688 [Dendrobium catenatum]
MRYSSYTWLAINEGLKSAENLALRGILITPACYLCQNEDESSSHMFFQCPFSFSILHSLLPDVRGFLLRPNLLQLFEHFEDCQSIEGAECNFCYFVICCTLYFLWRERNDRRYGGKYSTIHTLCHKISMAITAKVSKWKYFDKLQKAFPNCFFWRNYHQAENFDIPRQ